MHGHDIVRYLAIGALLASYVTILLGGNVMASDSGLACPDWPTCHGSYTPPLAGGTGIEWSHRLSALVLSLLIAMLTVAALLYERSRRVLLNLTFLCAGTVVVQAVLGAVVVRSDLSTAVVLLHLGLATLLFAALLVLAFLANLREVPRRWVAWAWKATELGPTESLPGFEVDAPVGSPHVPVRG
ncbi:MAG: COX15/CtaA family protein [Thermoplasmata archaeon]|nr:COX15/CtaA family protein [Thermoplasmata archaeon]